MYTKKVKRKLGKDYRPNKGKRLVDSERPIVTIAFKPIEYKKFERLARKNKIKMGAAIRALARFGLSSWNAKDSVKAKAPLSAGK